MKQCPGGATPTADLTSAFNMLRRVEDLKDLTFQLNQIHKHTFGLITINLDQLRIDKETMRISEGGRTNNL